MKTHEIYQLQEDGSVILIESTVIKVDEPTPEEIIAEKEAELMKIYAEIQSLKLK
jgi:hypothetical protein